MASKFVIPKTLGACADLAFELKQEKAELARAIADIEEKESALREHFINTVAKSDAKGVTGRVANVRVVSKMKPTAKDWDKIYKYIEKNDAWHIMQRRLSDTAIAEIWDGGKEVPGVDRFEAKTLSITKAK